MEILKEKTRSLCSTCYKEIDAQVFAENNSVYIRKKCDEHGELTSLAERDVDFYKRMMHKEPDPDPTYQILVIPVEYRCNMRCKYCYLPYEGQKNISFERIKEIVDNFGGPTIGLSGGEPTLREDLPEILEYIAGSGKTAVLLTNGLKLVDMDYLRRLKNAGLEIIFFGFNGFTDKSDTNIYNMPDSTKTKLKALENVREEKIRTVLSATIAKGTNDDQILPLFEYSARNSDFIFQLRFRSVTNVGRHGDEQGLFNSELLETFCKKVGLDKKHVLDKLDCGEYYNTNYHFNVRVFFHNDDGRIKLVPSMNWKTYNESSRFSRLIKVFNDLNAAETLKAVNKRIFNKKPLLGSLSVRFISWPDVNGFDLYEADRGTAHLYNQCEIINFCHAIILNDKL
jgi:uncharacterized radical SAM superfamily Fe-S cluster-containing enzyme